MPKVALTINGCITDRRTGSGVENLRVQLWAASDQGNVCLKEATTNGEGEFHMVLGDAELRRLAATRVTGIAMRILREGREIHTEAYKPSEILAAGRRWEPEIRVSLPVEPPPVPRPDGPDEFTVRGQVVLADGTPVPKAKVKAFDRGVSMDDQELGSDETDNEGAYSIMYKPAALKKRKERADLVVRAYDAEGAVLAASPLIVEALPEQAVDLVASRPAVRRPTEFSRIDRALVPLVQQVSAAKLGAKDLSYLAAKTGLDEGRVALNVACRRLAEESGIHAQVFHGLLRQGMPASIPALRAVGREALEQALAAAVADNAIDASILDDLDTIVDKLRARTIDLALTRHPLPDAGTLGDMLALAGVDGDGQRSFLADCIDRDGTLEAFWKAQEDPGKLGKDTAREVQRVLQFGAVTQNHLPLVKALRAQGHQYLRDLAGLGTEEWQALIETDVDGKKVGIPPYIKGAKAKDRYIGATMRLLEGIHPTAVLAREIRARSKNGKGIAQAAGVVRFLRKHPDFEFRDTPIDLYLAKDEDALKGIPKKEMVRSQLRALQRLFSITPDLGKPNTVLPLMNTQWDSARSIAQMSKEQAMQVLGPILGDEAVAEEVWENATKLSAMAVVLYAQYGPALNDVSMYALQGLDLATIEAQGIPNLDDLFGPLDTCECTHCRSVYSPAAYLVDALKFLDEIQAVNEAGDEQPDRTALDVLLDRRPDLGGIELDCENTDTALPYVDLVLETLENAVTRFALAADGLVADLDAENLSSALKDALEAKGVELSGDAAVVKDQAGRRWRVVDPGDGERARTYAILGKDAELTVYALGGYQTRARAEDLGARPEHLNPEAYVKLAQAAYPFDLPFDLWFEEGRVYAQHLGFERHPWMEKLRAIEPVSVTLANAVAADHLGLTEEELSLLGSNSSTNKTQEAKRWDLTGSVDGLEAVETLLKRAGLEPEQHGEGYRSLRQLLATRFLNPGGKIVVDFDGSKCDLEKAKLKDTSSAPGAAPKWRFYQKLRRFLRLQRKLGWTIPELDKALTAFGVNELTPALLRRLSNLERLRADLDLPLLEILSWWGAMDTAEDLSEEVVSKKAPSLYEQVFLDPSVDNPASALFALDPSRTRLALEGQQWPISAEAAIVDEDNAIAPEAVIGARKIDVEELLRLLGRGGDAINVAAAVIGALGITAEALDRLLRPKGPVEDKLTFDNLGELYRIISLACARGLTIREYLSVRALVEIDPFRDKPDGPDEVEKDRTANARKFVDRVRKIQASPLSIAELDYLLRHQYEEDTDHFVPTDGEIAAVLGGLVASQPAIDEAAQIPDPEGALLLERLKLLMAPTNALKAWRILGDRKRFAEDLASLPEGVEFSESLQGRVRYDEPAQKLRFLGVMTLDEKTLLLNLDATGEAEEYRAAVQNIYQSPREEIERYFCVLPGLVEMVVEMLDQGLAPEERFARVLGYIEVSLNQLRQGLAGALGLPTDVASLLLDRLVQGERHPQRTVFDDFVSLSADTLCPAPADSGRKCQEGMIQAAKSGPYTFRLDTEGDATLAVHGLMLTSAEDVIDLEAGKFYRLCVDHDAGQDAPAMLWTAPGALEEPVPAASLLPMTAIRSYRRLHKCALLIRGFDISADELSYLAGHAADFQGFDWNDLPLAATTQAAQVEAWWQLIELFTFRSRYSRAPTRIIDVLAAGHQSVEAARDQLCGLTGWEADDLRILAGPQGFGLEQEDVVAGACLENLHEAMALLRRLGIGAQQLVDWVSADPGASFANLSDAKLADKATWMESLKQAVKAKYDRNRWLEVARPLRDELREKQRSALVAYLVHDLDDVEDAIDLYAQFLVDVEMSPCMMTSRIKQALSTVQLFVQRCQMNLEKEVQIGRDHALRWAWMKQYRVWEANRKVFLYPENWIEPELRLTKSPFFVELENELLQNEVTDATVEAAYRKYLEKLDQVARLEMAGLYNDEEEDVVHVFGRTHIEPRVYYYRRWVDQSYWTPWEKVDLDIEGDHLLPVVYNRRLHLFWPIFELKSGEGESADKWYEIRLGWSEYRNGQWSAKQMADALVADSSVSKDKYRFRVAEDTEPVTIVAQTAERYNSGGLHGLCATPVAERFEFSRDGRVVSVELGGSLIEPIEYVEGAASEYMKYRLKPTEPLTLMIDASEPELTTDPMDAEGAMPIQTIAHEESVTVLGRLPSSAGVVLPHQYRPYISQAPFTFEDEARTFFVTTEKELIKGYVDHVGLGQLDLGIMEAMGPVFDMADITAGLPSLDGGPPNPMPPPLPIWASGALGTAESSIVGLKLLQGKTEGLSILGESRIVKCTYTFQPLYHPYVDLMIQQLNRYGIPGLLDPDPEAETCDELVPEIERLQRQQSDFEYFQDYDPETCVATPYPKEEFDFSYGGAYSLYNWELFFHAPLLIANRLSANQRFEEAQKWYHYVFDPTAVSAKGEGERRFWKIKPFYDYDPLHDLLVLFEQEGSDEEREQLLDQLNRQVTEWQDNPFRPHVVAGLRQVAYQKAVVGKYIENLLAWGDQLFQRFTIESLNEASQLYILAAEILGDRPRELPERQGTPIIDGQKVRTFYDMPEELGLLNNPLVRLESTLAPLAGGANVTDQSDTLSLIDPTFFFCIPRNEDLLAHWDTVADRLFKLRHCMTIEGIVRELPLFQPPIDPALLVRAAAAGLDIGSVLADLQAATPHYRFQVLLQKAVELCGEVRALGASLLSALEKKDAEELALMRSSQEVELLKAVKEMKKQRIDEAEETLASLQSALKLAEGRHQYYSSREYMNAAELSSMASLTIAQGLENMGQIYTMAASVANAVPQTHVQGVSSGTSTGGLHFGAAMRAVADSFNLFASQFRFAANLSATMGTSDRRWDEWQHQVKQALEEIEGAKKNTAAAEIGLAIAEVDLKNHELQITNAEAVQDYMKTKFTNQQLYSWMVSQISSVYFQSYQMAYDLAKRAERCYQHETCNTDSSFIQFGYWDSLKKGLLAGEKLHYDLRRMNVAYLEENKREYEITKHVSLAMLDPVALMMLKETGECYVNLPEAAFDLEHPGHYMRRIKSVSLTIPCVTGPYTNVSCTLTLLGSRIRKESSTAGRYAYRGIEDPRFQHEFGAVQSIAASSGQNDSGLFELNFRDERYLPFEGAGLISQWRLDLPSKFKQFDYDTISDVIFHIKYTARDGGTSLKETVTGELETALNQIQLGEVSLEEIGEEGKREGLFRAFSAKHEFSNEWHRFLHPVDDQTLTLDLSPDRFPFQFRGSRMEIDHVLLFLKLKEEMREEVEEAEDVAVTVWLTPPDAATSVEMQLTDSEDFRLLLLHSEADLEGFGSWKIEARDEDISQAMPASLRREVTIDGTTHHRLNPNAIEDIGIVCHVELG